MAAALEPKCETRNYLVNPYTLILTPLIIILFGKLIVSQLLKVIPAYSGSRSHKGPPVDPILSQMNPSTLPHRSFNLIFPLSSIYA
jgi:hypothetical protein